MTKKSLNLKTKPFLLQPMGKDYLWGGSRLNDDFSKGINMMPLAETWECSTHPEGQSIVASGEHRGMMLGDVLKEFPEYLGSRLRFQDGFPILIKFIDARSDLSVQVHPSDEYANIHENGQRGKSEMWYVLDTVGDAKLIYGFHHHVCQETIRKGIKNGTLEKYLQKVPVHKDDVFFIEAGTVHAIGAGILIAEIQENSNLTYRLFDYNRVDKNGNKRDLHIDKALTVLNLEGSSEPRQPMKVLRYYRGYASELLCRCKCFQAERLLINTERCREMAKLQTTGRSFEVLLCTNGCGTLIFGKSECLNFFRGDCIFIPANSIAIMIHGKAQFIKVVC